MPIAVTCPACKYSGRVPDQALGRRIKCPKCGKPFMVEADGAAPLPGTAATPPAEPPTPPSSPRPSPPAQQQPLPSAFDFEGGPPAPTKKTPTPLPKPAEEEKETPEPDSGDDSGDDDQPASSGAELPWFYRFVETYTKVAMILGIVLVTIGLLCQLGFAVLTLMAGREAMVLGIIMIVGGLIAYLVAILGILLLAALVLVLLDMAKNIREVRRMGEARQPPRPPE